MDSKTRAQKIKLLILDVDGVLTNGEIIFSRDGDAMKVFNPTDGLGLSIAQRNGIHIAIITGRQSDMVRLRAMELKIPDIYQGFMDKLQALAELQDKYGLSDDEIAYVGDDLNDLPVLMRAGLACAPANAVEDVKSRVHYVCRREGGRGAVREIVEMILQAQGKWDGIIQEYLNQGKQDRQ